MPASLCDFAYIYQVKSLGKYGAPVAWASYVKNTPQAVPVAHPLVVAAVQSVPQGGQPNYNGEGEAGPNRTDPHISSITNEVTGTTPLDTTATASTSSTSLANDGWQSTYQPKPAVYKSMTAMDVYDLAGVGDYKLMPAGEMVKVAGTFVFDGKTYARPMFAAIRKPESWYGIPLDSLVPVVAPEKAKKLSVYDRIMKKFGIEGR
jgi:hypothetical protein